MLFHWTSIDKASTTVASGTLKARRWFHFLEREGRRAHGSSWSLDPIRWQRDNPICLVLNEALIANPIHHINGNRTYLLTMGMDPDACFDPHAYKLESESPDEAFIEGDVDLRRALVRVEVIESAVHAWGLALQARRLKLGQPQQKRAKLKP